MNFVDWLIAKIIWLLILLVAGSFALIYLISATWGESTLPMGMVFVGVVLLALERLVDWSAHRHAKAAADPAETVVLKRSIFSLLLVSGAFLAFAGACVIPITQGIDNSTARLWAWLGFLVFCGSAIGIPIRRQFVSLTMSPEGLDYSSFNVGPIRWGDIAEASISRIFRTEYIRLRVVDEERHLGRRSNPIKAWLRWRIAIQDFDVSSQWLLKAIQLRLDHFGAGGSVHSPTVQRQGTH
ncbi:MAG TPA: hypothetical protein PLR41_02505 [Alphaproteobacteria bacterium]|nr:hypothetical protein [Alphaproteobacteria bacterium]